MASFWDRVSANGQEMKVCVSVPGGTGPFPAIVVIQHQGGVDAGANHALVPVAGHRGPSLVDGGSMPRIALDLNKAEDRQVIRGEWRVAGGLVPGEPNEGLTAQLRASPARLVDHDDSGWETCPNIRESRSVGFTFAWYRIAIVVPERVGGVALAGSRVWFETNIDNYGEIWIDGQIDRSTGVIVGINAQHRVEVSGSAVAGAGHVIACLVANGPLAEPRGGIFMRYATLAFESPG